MNIQAMDEYFFFDRDLIDTNPYPTMMEIGAFSGTMAERFWGFYPNSKMVVVEADAENFVRLLKSCRELKLERPNVLTLHYALAAVDGPVTLYRYTSRNSHSLFQRKRTPAAQSQVVVEGKCLTSLLEKAGIYQLDLLLLNCEGAELFALQDLLDSSELREQIPQICVGSHRSKIYRTPVWNQLVEALKAFYSVEKNQTNQHYHLLRSRKYAASK